MEVGGDVYDYLTLDDGRLAVVLGDVTGHGVDAAADMAMAKYVFRSLARDHADPGTFLAAANDVVSSEIAPGRFITMVELVLRRAAGRGRVRERRPPAAAARPPGRDRRVDLGARARARHRRPAGVRDRHGAVPARRDRGRLHGRRDRGAARRRAVRRRAAGRAAGGASARCRRRRSREAALAACRDWTEGELTDDFAVVVVKRAEPRHEPQPGSSRGARLRRRHRLARDRDRGLAHARAVLRLVDDRLGEPDRDRPRRARARLLARRQARRPAARAPPARADRPRGGALGRDDAVRRAAVPRRRRRQPRRRVGRRRDRLLLRRPAPLRAGRRPARDGLAVRDPARDHRRRDRRRGRRPLLRALDLRLAARDVRARADRDPARRDAADAARDRGAAGALGLVPARPEGRSCWRRRSPRSARSRRAR